MIVQVIVRVTAAVIARETVRIIAATGRQTALEIAAGPIVRTRPIVGPGAPETGAMPARPNGRRRPIGAAASTYRRAGGPVPHRHAAARALRAPAAAVRALRVGSAE